MVSVHSIIVGVNFSFKQLNVGRDTFEASATECSKSTKFRDDICGPIASSMDESMFQLVISRWRNAFDALKETKNYKFLSAAGSLMKSMVICTSWLTKCY